MRIKIGNYAVKGFFSILFAYPLSGALYAIFIIVNQIIAPVGTPDFRVGPVLFLITLWTLVVPAEAGIVSDDGFFPYVNMYPWIIPTAGALFFLFSKGWRWFKRKA
jgi:hypothetical protein